MLGPARVPLKGACQVRQGYISTHRDLLRVKGWYGNNTPIQETRVRKNKMETGGVLSLMGTRVCAS